MEVTDALARLRGKEDTKSRGVLRQHPESRGYAGLQEDREQDQEQCGGDNRLGRRKDTQGGRRRLGHVRGDRSGDGQTGQADGTVQGKAETRGQEVQRKGEGLFTGGYSGETDAQASFRAGDRKGEKVRSDSAYAGRCRAGDGASWPRFLHVP